MNNGIKIIINCKTDFPCIQFMNVFSVKVNPKNFKEFFPILVKQKHKKTENTRD